MHVQLSKIMPTAPEVLREAIVTVAGAVLAAAVIGALPSVRAWMKQQWAGSKP